MQIEDMPVVRIFFSKKGRAKYTSHLDTVRTLTRAFRRSGLPVWYTQGFNPHIYMNFPLPIALGYESESEPIDVRFTEDMSLDEIVFKLNNAFPPGFLAVRAAVPLMDASAIKWAEYEVRLIYKDTPLTAVKDKLTAFLDLSAIEVQKKTKKSDKIIDIKPTSKLLSAEIKDGALLLKLRMAAGNEQNINPTLLLKAFYAFSDIVPDGIKITRTAILDEKFSDFA